jgi:hypothetical protein
MGAKIERAKVILHCKYWGNLDRARRDPVQVMSQLKYGIFAQGVLVVRVVQFHW